MKYPGSDNPTNGIAGAHSLDHTVDQLEESTAAPVALVVAGQDMTEAYWLILDAFHRSRGLPPWRSRRDHAILTAAEVNEAVEWWNRNTKVEEG